MSCGCPREGKRSVRAGAFVVRASLYAPGCSTGMHAHADARIVVPLGEAFETRSRRRHFVVANGDAIVRPAAVAHEDRYTTTVGCVAVSCGDGRLDALASELVLARARDVGRLAAEIGTELARDEPDAVAALTLESLCSALVDATLRRDGAPPWLDAMRAQLDGGPGDELTLRALAERAGLDPAHVARAFKRRFAVSVGAYGRRVRLRRAYRLLRAGRPLAESAALAGFADQSHLSRAFRAAFGTTPGAVRGGTSSVMRNA